MDTKPMSESEGDFKGGFRKVPGLKCRKCNTEAVFSRTWESDCGGYEDEKYQCRACGHVWWVEGPDA